MVLSEQIVGAQNMKKKTNQKPIHYRNRFRNYYKLRKYGEYDSRLGYIAAFTTDRYALPGIFVRIIGDPINCNAMVRGVGKGGGVRFFYLSHLKHWNLPPPLKIHTYASGYGGWLWTWKI